MPRTKRTSTRPAATVSETHPDITAEDHLDRIPTPLDGVDHDVAAEAYRIYCERGCVDGYDVEDWIEAERRLNRTS